MFYKYVIKSKKDKKCYTGETADLRKRFREHGENKAISTNDKLKRFLSLTGFTLIEILFVVIIIAILIGTSLPGLKNTFDGMQLNAVSSRLQSYMNYLCEHSIVTGKVIYLYINNDDKKYWAVAQDQSVLKTIAIPEGIKIEPGDEKIAFYPDGTIDKVTLNLSNNNHQYINLTTKGVFGGVKIQPQ